MRWFSFVSSYCAWFTAADLWDAHEFAIVPTIAASATTHETDAKISGRVHGCLCRNGSVMLSHGLQSYRNPKPDRTEHANGNKEVMAFGTMWDFPITCRGKNHRQSALHKVLFGLGAAGQLLIGQAAIYDLSRDDGQPFGVCQVPLIKSEAGFIEIPEQVTRINRNVVTA